MNRPVVSFLAVLVWIGLVATACAPTAGPAPTQAPAAPPKAAEPASAPAAAPAPTQVPPGATAKPAEVPKSAAPTATVGVKPGEKASSPVIPSVSAVLGDEYSFEQVVTVSGVGPQEVKMAFKKGKIRMETSAGGQQAIFLADSAAQTAYMVMPEQKQALKMPFQQFEEQEKSSQDPIALTRDLPSSQVVGTETIDGKLCDVYSVSNSNGTIKVWLWREKSFPLKVEVAAGGQQTTVEFRNFQVGGLPDSLFELPKDVTVMDLGNLPGMMQNLPGPQPAKP